MCYKEFSNGDVHNGNFRFTKKANSDVALKLWDKAVALGVDGGEEFDYHVESIRCL